MSALIAADTLEDIEDVEEARRPPPPPPMGNLLITPENTSLSLSQHLSAQHRPDTCRQVAQRQGQLNSKLVSWLAERQRQRQRPSFATVDLCLPV